MFNLNLPQKLPITSCIDFFKMKLPPPPPFFFFLKKSEARAIPFVQWTAFEVSSLMSIALLRLIMLEVPIPLNLAFRICCRFFLTYANLHATSIKEELKSDATAATKGARDA